MNGQTFRGICALKKRICKGKKGCTSGPVVIWSDTDIAEAALLELYSCILNCPADSLRKTQPLLAVLSRRPDPLSCLSLEHMQTRGEVLMRAPELLSGLRALHAAELSSHGSWEEPEHRSHTEEPIRPMRGEYEPASKCHCTSASVTQSPPTPLDGI